MYENMKARIEEVIERGKVDEDCINTEEELQAFTKYWTTGFSRHNHASIIQVNIYCTVVIQFINDIIILKLNSI